MSFLAVLGFAEPDRNVATGVKHTPDINMVRALDVENKPRIASEAAMTQPRQIQLVRVARRADAGMF